MVQSRAAGVRHLVAGMSSCSTISPSTNSQRCAAIKTAGAQTGFYRPTVLTSIPIERAFAKLKAFLWAARSRNFDHVTAFVAAALALFTPADVGITADTAANWRTAQL